MLIAFWQVIMFTAKIPVLARNFVGASVEAFNREGSGVRMILMRRVGALAVAGLALTSAAVFAESPPVAVPGAPPVAVPTAVEERGPWIVGAALLNPMTKEVFNRLRVRAPSVPEPRIENHNLVQDIQSFCSGTGADTPDVLALSRSMGVSEFELCSKNGVTDIVEVQIGLEALVLVTRKDDPDLPLTFDILFHAIASDLPDEEAFVPNTSHTWNDVNRKLPKTEIKVVIPSRTTSSRPFFDNRFMQGACREIFEYKNIYSAEERVAQCIGVRRDDHVIELGLPYSPQSVIATLERTPRGSVAVMSLRYALEASDKLKTLPLEGVVPDRDTVSSQTYPATRRLMYYVKAAHVKDYFGNGPVLGLREFITEVTRESAIGDSGYLVPLGLVTLPDGKRVEVRRSALSLTRMIR